MSAHAKSPAAATRPAPSGVVRSGGSVRAQRLVGTTIRPGGIRI
jgi:hypothetical protein